MSALRDYVAAEAANRLLRFRLQRTVVLANPAVATDFSSVVPGGVYWEVLAFAFVLTTSAAVGARNVALRFRDPDGNVAWRGESSNAQNPTTAVAYSFVSGLGAGVTGTGVSMPLADPPGVLLPGWRIGTSTTGLDVADQYSAGVLTIVEWSPAQVGQHMEKVLGDSVFSTYAERFE